MVFEIKKKKDLSRNNICILGNHVPYLPILLDLNIWNNLMDI